MNDHPAVFHSSMAHSPPSAGRSQPNRVYQEAPIPYSYQRSWGKRIAYPCNEVLDEFLDIGGGRSSITVPCGAPFFFLLIKLLRGRPRTLPARPRVWLRLGCGFSRETFQNLFLWQEDLPEVILIEIVCLTFK